MSTYAAKYNSFSYKELQAIAMRCNIPGNLKRAILIDTLVTLETGNKEELESKLRKYKADRYRTVNNRAKKNKLPHKVGNNKKEKTKNPGRKKLNATRLNSSDGGRNLHPNVDNNNVPMDYSLRPLTGAVNREGERFLHRRSNNVENEDDNHDNSNNTQQSLSSSSDSTVSAMSSHSYFDNNNYGYFNRVEAPQHNNTNDQRENTNFNDTPQRLVNFPNASRNRSRDQIETSLHPHNHAELMYQRAQTELSYQQSFIHNQTTTLSYQMSFHQQQRYPTGPLNNHSLSNLETNSGTQMDPIGISKQNGEGSNEQNRMLIDCPSHLLPSVPQLETSIEDRPTVYEILDAPTQRNNITRHSITDELMGELAGLNTSSVDAIIKRIDSLNDGNQSAGNRRAGNTNSTLIPNNFVHNAINSDNTETDSFISEFLQDHSLSANVSPTPTETTPTNVRFPIIGINEQQCTRMNQPNPEPPQQSANCHPNCVMIGFNEHQNTRMWTQKPPPFITYDEPHQQAPMVFQPNIHSTPVNRRRMNGNQPMELNVLPLFGNAVMQPNLEQRHEYPPRIWFKRESLAVMHTAVRSFGNHLPTILEDHSREYRQCVHHAQGCREMIETLSGMTHECNCKYQIVKCPHEMCLWEASVNELLSHVQFLHRSCIRVTNSMIYSVGTHQFTIKNSYTYLQEYNGVLYVVRATRVKQDVILTLQYISQFDEESRPPKGTIQLLDCNNSVFDQWAGELCPYYVPHNNLINTKQFLAFPAVMNINFFSFKVTV